MKILNIFIGCAISLLILSSCSDSNVSPQTNPNLCTIKVIDADTKQPIQNAKIELNYTTEDARVTLNSTEEVEDNNYLTAAVTYPNPTTGSFNLYLKLLNSCKIRIEAYDYVTQSLIRTYLPNTDFAVGEHLYTIGSDTLFNHTPGFYALKVFCNDTFATSLTVLNAAGWFVFEDETMPREGSFMKLYTNIEGKAEFDKSKFTQCNIVFDRFDVTGKYENKYLTINGCHCCVSYDGKTLNNSKIEFDKNNAQSITIEVKK